MMRKDFVCQVRDLSKQLEVLAKSSERTGAAQMKAEADAAAAARLASASRAAADARVTDVEKSRDYYKVTSWPLAAYLC